MKAKKCEIISVGNEILSGQGGESSYLAARILSGQGVDISRITHTGDRKKQIKQVLKETFSRSSFIIIIGGTGSTPDDNTRVAVSEFLDIELKFSRKAMENVAAYFSRRDLEVPRHCDDQAEVLNGAKVLKNKKGSAPGQLIKVDKKLLLILPGPPAEVNYILNKRVDKSVLSNFTTEIRKEKSLRTTGLCEGELAELLKEVIETERHLEESEIDFYFRQTLAGVDIVISCHGGNEILVDELLHKIKDEIYGEIESYIYGEDGETLQEVVGKLLTSQRKKLAVAESCTGGLLSSKITDAPGSSIYFITGMVTYSNQAKKDILNIDKKIIEDNGAVSQGVAGKMAENIMEKTGADITLSVTGFAGPKSSSNSEPGEGYIGLKTGGKVKVKKVNFNGTRKDIKEKFAYKSLDMLRKYLENR
ncbi:MAG: CinA family nicotinamide mononucleotide deamidase-related protein [Elusimicrobiota bacterium]